VSAEGWIESGLEVLVDSEEAEPCDVDTQELVAMHGLASVLQSLRIAADSAHAHISEGSVDGTIGEVARIDRFRAAMRDALGALS